MSQKPIGSHDQIHANTVTHNNNINSALNPECNSFTQNPSLVAKNTTASFQVICQAPAINSQLPSVSNSSSNPNAAILPTVPIATHHGNGYYPGMLATDGMYQMASTPVFMTPPAYPQVALIPEGDLLRSMIVQDVKQVTEKLLEKRGKKKRGRRKREERNEKFIAGDYGTLKVNFKRFFKEPPPMTCIETKPKRTVYHRIAPRQPVACTVTTSVSDAVPSIPSLEPGTNSTTNGIIPDGLPNSSIKNSEKKSKPNLNRTARSKGNTSKYKETCTKVGIPVSVQPEVSNPKGSFVNRLEEIPKNDPFSIPKDPPDVCGCSRNDLNSLLTEFQTGSSVFINSSSSGSSVHTHGSSSGVENRPNLQVSSNGCNSLTNETTQQSSNMCPQGNTDDIFDMTLSNLISSSQETDNPLNGVITTLSSFQTNTHDELTFRMDVGSPSAEIGSEFNHLLSELYSDFPGLCPNDMYGKMDVITTEGGMQNTQTTNGSLLVDGTTMSQQTSTSTINNNNTSSSNQKGDTSFQSIQKDTPVSSVNTHQNATSSQSTTEVVNDSSWTREFDRNPCPNTASTPLSSLNSRQHEVSSHSTMEVVNDSSWTSSFGNDSFSNTTNAPVPSVTSRENEVYPHSTTEVVNDSTWTCGFENNPFSNATESLLVTPSGPRQAVAENTVESLANNNNNVPMETNADAPCDLVDVIDMSPEYASTEGDGKIILIGSWNNKAARYSCRFGDVSVAADLIQNGVLRCYCPPYKPGKVKVSVLCDDVILSKPIDFEYVDTEEVDDKAAQLNHDWLTIKDDDLKKLLVERVEALCGVFDSKNNISLIQGHSSTSIGKSGTSIGQSGTCMDLRRKTSGQNDVTFGSDLEDILTKICESLSKIRSTITTDCKSEKVMTVLHLSAALGFTKLIQVLCNWIEINNNPIIIQEANPRKQDQFQLTPLMWACAKGKFDTVCVLLQWDETTSQQTDGCGCTPLSISKGQGHTILERYLERSQSRGHNSKHPCLISDSGSPLLQVRGRLSRSSSTNSQLDQSRDVYSGLDDNSPDSTNGFPCSRTLGQTLAYVQAIMQDGVDDRDESSRSTPLTSIDVDDDSLFVPSPFTPRPQNTSCDDIRLNAQTPRSSLSSLSPGSPGHNSSVQSPFDPSMKDTAEFCEFFYNSDRILEKDFAELTLTDEEQQNLYKAASVIQNAYKGYRERRKQRDSELSAAVLIQSYYRRYKQYATFKKMQKGAVVIQHKYRAHREKEKQKSHAASVIQTYYRKYKERKRSPRTDGLDLQQKSRVMQLADRKASRFRTQTNNRNRDSTGDPASKT